jgi:TorA maturation chaperone TorD
MSGIAARRFGALPGADETIFENHLAPWIGRFFTDLERAEGAKFYRSVGTLGRIFIDIETEAFALPS